MKKEGIKLEEEIIKTENKKAWPKFNQLIDTDKLLKYKKVDFAIDHIKYSQETPICIEPEFDGISLTLYYENGALTHTVLNEGSDIFANSADFNNIPQNIATNFSLVIVKGVLAVSKTNFEKVKDNYANSRYAAAGIARRLDGLNSNLLDFIPYNIYIKITDKIEEVKDRNMLKTLGFILPFNLLSENGDYTKVLTDYTSFIKSSNYNIVGVFVRAHNYEFLLKTTSNIAETKITNYNWILTPTNKYIPMVDFEPVELDGTTVTTASLSSAKNYIDMNAPKGSIITVTKAEGFIPYIEKVIERPEKTKLTVPTKCPLCNEDLIWVGKHLVCDNPLCKNKLISQCVQIVDMLKVVRFTEKLVIDLINAEKIKKAEDIFTLEPEDIMTVKYRGRFISSKQALVLVKSIHKRKAELTDRDFIFALCIPKITYNFIDKIKAVATEQGSTLLLTFEKCDISILSKVLKEDKIKAIVNFMTKQRDMYDSLKYRILGI